jgi:hypothetical protein
MTPATFVIFPILLLAIVVALVRDFARGLALSLGIFVFVPRVLAIPLGICEMTLVRCAFIIALPLWLSYRNRRRFAEIPFRRVVVALILCNVFSMLLSTTPAASFKGVLGLVTDAVAWYFVVSSVATTEDTIEPIIRKLCWAYLFVGLVAAVEKYKGVNLMASLFGGAMLGLKDTRGVIGCYPHRILLGYAMDFGFLLALGLVARAESGRQRRTAWLLALVPVAACYYSGSRGPWAGMAMGTGVLFLFGGRAARKAVTMLGVAGVVLLMLRPGILETMMVNLGSSFNGNTVRGKSAEYRWTLWRVAWGEVSKSPIRLLIGYGPKSTESMDLSGYFGHQMGGTTDKVGFTSWDSQYACDFIELGAVGLFIDIYLHIKIILTLWRGLKSASERARPLIAAMAGCCAVYFWAMTNVAMYSNQLNVAFWAILAMGINLTLIQEEPASETEALNSATELELSDPGVNA